MKPFMFLLDDINEEDVDDAESEWISNYCLFILYSWQSCFLKVWMPLESIRPGLMGKMGQIAPPHIP